MAQVDLTKEEGPAALEVILVEPEVGTEYAVGSNRFPILIVDDDPGSPK